MSRTDLPNVSGARALLALALLLAATLPLGALAEGSDRKLAEVATIALPDALRRDLVGQAVAASDELVIVGAPGADRVADGTGLVMVLRRDGDAWHPGTVITDEAAGVAASFGAAVATNGTTLLVGAPRDLADRGASYLYEHDGNGWNRVARLELPDGAAFDFFGSAVAIDGDTALIGAPGHDAVAIDAGAAVLYRRGEEGWQEQARLRPGELEEGSRFGAAVALTGDLAVVAAPDGGTGGVVHLFERRDGAWVSAGRLAPDELVEGDAFGGAVATDGSSVVVGARFATIEHDQQGVAYLFERHDEGWRQTARWSAEDAGRRDAFGYSVAVRGDLALIGAPRHDAGGDDAGAVFAYRRDGDVWTSAGTLARATPDVYDEFGSALAMNQRTVFVGVPYDVLDGAENDTGSVVVYR